MNHQTNGNSGVEQLLTLTEVEKILRVTARHLYDLRQSRKLQAVKIGRRVRFRREDVDACIRLLLETPDGGAGDGA